MHPELFKIGPLTIHTYGVLVAAGFLLGLALAVKQARKEDIPPNKIVDLGRYVHRFQVPGYLFKIRTTQVRGTELLNCRVVQVHMGNSGVVRRTKLF